MKFLFDFDGTLTDICHECAFELSRIQDVLLDSFGLTADEFNQLYQTAMLHIQKDPCQFGWYNNGRIASFSDEDLFITIAAAMTLLDHWFPNPPENLAAIFSKVPSPQFMKITEDAHAAMNGQPLCEFNTPESDAVDTIKTLLDEGHEIVVASNSPASRIIPKFEFVGLHPVDHLITPDAPFRIRGRAGKFMLGNSPDSVDFGPRTVDIDRPAFRKIIEEETPDFSIGDVFSLDIALPAVMASRNSLKNKIQLVLRIRSYTPSWALECIQSPVVTGNSHYAQISQFNELLDIVRNHCS